MDAKQYLRQLRRLDDMVNAKLDQVHELRCLAEKVTSAPSLDGVRSSFGQDKMAEVVAKIVDLESSINRDIDELIDLKTSIIALVDSLEDDDYRLILTYRYLNFKTWEQIAVDMGYTYRHVTRLHGQALLGMKDVLECPSLDVV